MLPARRFWANLIASVLGVAAQFLILWLFFVGYMPTFGKQPIDQKITIVVSLATVAVFFIGEIGVIISSIMYERPSVQRLEEA